MMLVSRGDKIHLINMETVNCFLRKLFLSPASRGYIFATFRTPAPHSENVASAPKVLLLVFARTNIHRVSQIKVVFTNFH